jgi:hypothetical protein
VLPAAMARQRRVQLRSTQDTLGHQIQKQPGNSEARASSPAATLRSSGMVSLPAAVRGLSGRKVGWGYGVFVESALLAESEAERPGGGCTLTLLSPVTELVAYPWGDRMQKPLAVRVDRQPTSSPSTVNNLAGDDGCVW